MIMLLIALPPAPPTPHTTMRGFSSFSWGAFRLIGIPCLSCWALVDAASPPSMGWPLGIAFPPAPTYDTCPALSGPSLRQAGDFIFMLNARLNGDGKPAW